MTPKQILKEITDIQPNNRFLHYIVERIQDKDYRGLHISQHNRHYLERDIKIATAIYLIAGQDTFRIPPGDDKGATDANCKIYYKIVKKVKENAGVGSINSLKKNVFVDFHRMGLLHRFDNKNNQVLPDKRGQIYYAQLTPLAIELIKSPIIRQYKIFTDALDNLFKDEISRLAELLYYSKYKDTPIGLIEFMLILSDDRPQVSNNKIDLINSYRKLKLWQRAKAIKLIQRYCVPSNFIGSKTNKRDFENWKNQAQQIFTLLKNTVYFDITPNSLRLNIGKYGFFKEHRIKQRNLGAKQQYFEKHRIGRRTNFELHHIISFSSARNKEEFQAIDNWQNLIYLYKDKHCEITRKKDKHIILSANRTDISFKNFQGDFIIAKNGLDAEYLENLVQKMEKYNKSLLKEIYEYDGNL